LQNTLSGSELGLQGLLDQFQGEVLYEKKDHDFFIVEIDKCRPFGKIRGTGHRFSISICGT
jgi:hypothetical protein